LSNYWSFLKNDYQRVIQRQDDGHLLDLGLCKRLTIKIKLNVHGRSLLWQEQFRKYGQLQ
jgi:hypothetical protein